MPDLDPPAGNSTPLGAPPQYSADRRWWWNGQEWQFVPPAVSAPRRSRATLIYSGILLVVGLYILVVNTIGAIRLGRISFIGLGLGLHLALGHRSAPEVVNLTPARPDRSRRAAWAGTCDTGAANSPLTR